MGGVVMNEIKHSVDEIVEKEFEVVNRGYSPRQVDAFLDEIIADFESIKEIEEYYKVQNLALQKTNSILRSRIDELEIQIDMNKSAGYQNADNSSNIDLIKKIAKLEGELYQTKLQLEEEKAN